MIKVKGRDVIFTGKDAKELQELCDKTGETPHDILVSAIREMRKKICSEKEK